MQIKFSLSVHIEGESLDEIDQGLIQAAGKRLEARIHQKIGVSAVNGAAVPIGPQPIQPSENLSQNLKIKVTEAVDGHFEHLEKSTSTLPGQDPLAASVTEPKKETRGRKPKSKETDEVQNGQHPDSATTTPHSQKTEIGLAPSAPDTLYPQGLTGPNPDGTPAPTPSTPTKEDAVKALTKVNEKFGMERARAILNNFGVDRLSKLEESKFAEFKNACEIAVG